MTTQEKIREAARLLREVNEKSREQAGTIEGLRAGNRQTREENTRLSHENNRLHGENERLTARVKELEAQIAALIHAPE